MLDLAFVAFATFFATIGPLDIAAMFAVLTNNASPAERFSMAVRGTVAGAVILLVFAFLGDAVLTRLGISLAAFKTAGGILLLLIGIDMVFARNSGGVSTTADENVEARGKEDIAIFPLATPLIAGPAAIGSVMLLISDAQGDWLVQATVIGAMLAVLLITFAMLIGASQIQRLLGVTGLNVISRVFGILLAAMAVQFVFDGIAQSGLIP